MIRTLLPIFVALLAFHLPVAAQSAETPPGSEKPVHEHPHERVLDPSRFTTSRTSQVKLPLPGEKDAFFFAVLGDRTGGPAEGVKVLAEAVGELNVIEPDLVMTVGDLIQGYNQTDGWMEQMREYRGIMDGLEMPWFPVAGNHDVYWRGPNRPAGEHETNYELHFGPLWYAFEHKDCWFIALYSDEGDAEGNKAFNRPASQKMSPEQFAWLKSVLAKAKDARHVFVFLHHPRWLGRGYGDDWNRVHAELVKAGNVSGVFAGHIHRMRYDGKRDGIEYFTLATTGGGQSGLAPKAGYLHHYHLVTVRDGRIAVSAVPVGEVMDVRKISGEISDAARALHDGMRPRFDRTLELAPGKPVDELIKVTLENPLERAIELAVVPHTKDGRFTFGPDHTHLVIGPKESNTLTFRVSRAAGPIDQAFDLPKLEIQADYLAEGARVRIMETSFAIPMMPTDLGHPAAADGSTLMLARGTAPYVIPADTAAFTSEIFTLEGWLKADRFTRRQGFLAKTENSEYGIFVNRGEAHFSVHLDGRYVTARAPADVRMKPGRWHHVAGAFDGEKVLLWIDGKLVATQEGSGKRTRNALPLVIGADVDRAGRSTSPFLGEIDEVRLSSTVRYSESGFTPSRRHEPDEHTHLLLHLDRFIGPWSPDTSGHARHAVREQHQTSSGH